MTGKNLAMLTFSRKIISNFEAELMKSTNLIKVYAFTLESIAATAKFVKAKLFENKLENP